VTRDHYGDIDLGEDVPPAGTLWLLTTGWIPLAVARADLGFRAGKTKTIPRSVADDVS